VTRVLISRQISLGCAMQCLQRRTAVRVRKSTPSGHAAEAKLRGPGLKSVQEEPSTNDLCTWSVKPFCRLLEVSSRVCSVFRTQLCPILRPSIKPPRCIVLKLFITLQ
jgi:hypothetical protein